MQLALEISNWRLFKESARDRRDEVWSTESQRAHTTI
jgi:hypothetical protein